MKTLTPVLIAFFLGMILCFTIQACADDKDERSAPNTNNGTGLPATYGWDTVKLSTEETYSTTGELELKKEYFYDSDGRLIEEKIYEYDQNGTLVMTNFFKYTYEGNRRIVRDDEGGKRIQTLYVK